MADASHSHGGILKESELEFLDIDRIRIIDEALQSIGTFGEVRLIVDKNRLRFIVCQTSFDALELKPGQIKKV